MLRRERGASLGNTDNLSYRRIETYGVHIDEERLPENGGHVAAIDSNWYKAGLPLSRRIESVLPLQLNHAICEAGRGHEEEDEFGSLKTSAHLVNDPITRANRPRVVKDLTLPKDARQPYRDSFDQGLVIVIVAQEYLWRHGGGICVLCGLRAGTVEF